MDYRGHEELWGIEMSVAVTDLHRHMYSHPTQTAHFTRVQFMCFNRISVAFLKVVIWETAPSTTSVYVEVLHYKK